MKPIETTIKNIDKTNKTCLVQSQNGNIFPVIISSKIHYLLEDIRLGDTGIVTKSPVTGEWLLIDYNFCNQFNYAVHNSLQTDMDDLIVDEEGVPYDF